MQTSFQHIMRLTPGQGPFDLLLKRFNAGKPLTPAQLNLLRRFYYRLGSEFNPVLKQYKLAINPPVMNNSNSRIELADQSRLPLSLRNLPYPLNIFPHTKLGKGIELKFAPNQFPKFKLELQDIHDLILYRGNQLLTGAPFYPGAVPHIEFFQWGNLFGVIKYHELLEEKSLKGNILIYFEDLANRNLQQCVNTYTQQLLNQLTARQNVLSVPTPTPQSSQNPLSHLLQPTSRLELRLY